MTHALKRPSYQIKKRTLLAKFKKPKRRIQFDTETDVAPAYASNPEVVTAEELRMRWYSSHELKTFKQDAVKLALLTNKKYGKDVFPRGMEACTEERLRHKASTLKCVLMAHRHGKSSEYLAELYRQCADWNRDIAFQRALRDYFDIYYPSMAHGIPAQNSKPPKITVVSRRPPPISVTTASSHCHRLNHLQSNAGCDASQNEYRLREQARRCV